MKTVLLYTDGACKGNPGPGGWAAILIYGKKRLEISGASGYTTNNRMELTAIIEGLRRLKYPCRVIIYTDSQYVMKGITEWVKTWQKRGWKTCKKRDVLNRELWQALLKELSRHEVEWRWVKGHSGNVENERCDLLANQAIEKLKG
ncbi:MAG: ribonuclease HI [Nitrospirae bacterium]|nr:MAG: ribonuclease HI [Nitrospirota bacterium]